jgi:hypothetical protein
MARDLRHLPWRILLVLNLLVAIGSALFWVALFVKPTSFSQNPTDEFPVAFAVKGNTAVELAALLGFALLVGDVLWLVYGRRPRAPSHHVVSDAPDGPLKISREALESGLRLAGESVDEVSRLRVSVDPSGMKRVVVRAQFQALEGVSIQLASQKLRSAIQRRFGELVRLVDGSRLEIDIEFLGFAGKPARKPGSSPAPREEPSSFTGPKYPIDDEDPFEGRGHP